MAFKSKFDSKILSEEIVEWSKQDTSINMCAFCAERGYPSFVILEMIKECKEFKGAFDIASMQLAERRERYLNSGHLNVKTWERYARLYDPFLDNHETSLENIEADRKRGIATTQELNLVALARMAAEGAISQKR